MPWNQALITVRLARAQLGFEATRLFELAAMVFVVLRPLLLQRVFEPGGGGLAGLRLLMDAVMTLVSTTLATVVVVLPVAISLAWRSHRHRRLEFELEEGTTLRIPVARLPVPAGRSLCPFLGPGRHRLLPGRRCETSIPRGGTLVSPGGKLDVSGKGRDGKERPQKGGRP